MAEQVKPQQPKPAPEVYIDRVDLSEIYVDALHNVSYQAPTLRLELCILRFDQGLGGGDPVIKKIPACRLAMPIETVIALTQKLQQAIQGLVATGQLKAIPDPDPKQKH